MAYEVASDLRHTRYLRNAPDIMTWANLGPGSKRGINRVLGEPLGASVSDQLAQEVFLSLLEYLQSNWPNDWPALEMREVEHSLCEFDKYMRVKLGQGRPRAKYPGTGDT